MERFWDLQLWLQLQQWLLISKYICSRNITDIRLILYVQMTPCSCAICADTILSFSQSNFKHALHATLARKYMFIDAILSVCFDPVFYIMILIHATHITSKLVCQGYSILHTEFLKFIIRVIVLYVNTDTALRACDTESWSLDQGLYIRRQNGYLNSCNQTTAEWHILLSTTFQLAWCTIWTLGPFISHRTTGSCVISLHRPCIHRMPHIYLES